ncbi:TonB-dependent receptor [Parahaliea aestuarii]|uniref:TonB-dependent receptor n=1 Tax=Parahaliea aestuarii TaxID=1852021 RepID=A0A5C9A2U3_9GAMM|nr:TonB-dependent receptor [Parahaliea aestuarii]TXS95036.1 TonB-dependent receptor [Parahaliea aestuarii]
MNGHKSGRLPLAFATAAAMAATIPANAQDIPGEGARTGGLEEVIVTARKREESLQDAPLTVSAMSQDRIEKFDVSSLEKLASFAPQLYVGRSSNGSGAQITLRGIGSNSTSIGIEQSVAVILDGVYYGQGRVLNEGMFDMAQIELLKGPQTLFFGKNATAGVISLTSAKPTEEFEATGRIQYEWEAEQTRYEGIVSGPLTDRIGARLAVRYSDMDGGYFENQSTRQPYELLDVATGDIISDFSPADNRDAPGEEETLARLTLTFDPTDRLAMTLSASMTDAEVYQSSWNYTAFNCPGGVGGLNPNLRCGDNFVIAQNRMPSILARSLPYARSNGDLFNEYESYSITANIEYDFGDYSLVSITNQQENENTFGLSGDFQSIPSATFATENSTWEAFSEELRLASQFDGRFNFMLGVLYQKTEREFDQWVSTAGVANTAAPSPELVYVASQKQSYTDGETIAPFFEITYDLTESLTLSAGARYSDETKESEFVHPYNNPGLGGIWRTNEIAAADQSFEETSPEVTLSWQMNDSMMLYGAFKTAYKSGGFSNSGIFSADFMGGSESDFIFGPETAEGFEFGIKSTLLDNQLRLNGTVYDYEYDNLQVDFFNSPTFAFITLNAGKATTRGFELDAEYAPFNLAGLSFRGTLAYNEAEYDDFVAPCWAGQTQQQGCSTTVPGTNGTPGQDISGAPTAMAPEWTASFGVNYDDYLANGWGYGVALDGVYSDEYNASAFDNPHAMRDSYTLWNMSAYLTGKDDVWELQLLGKNLTDEHIVSGVVDGPSTPVAGGAYADQMGFTSLPRTVALQLTVRYN